MPKKGLPPFRLVVLIHGYTASKDGWFSSQDTLVTGLVSEGFAVVVPAVTPLAGMDRAVVAAVSPYTTKPVEWIVKHLR